ncbi:MAG: ABC transporter ATP-binding protein [Chitinophagaceae bacterium]
MELIEITGVSKVIKHKSALSDISLRFHKSENAAIIGETGSGKSTLLKAIAGLVQPDTGKIFLNGKKVLGPDEKLIPGHDAIAYLSQHYELPIHLRVEQVLEYANTLSAGQELELYKICHIEHLMKRKTHELSGGEKQRIALVRLLLGQPQVLLLDEPFSNFDNIHKNEMMGIVGEISQKWGITCIMVSHAPKDVLAWSDRIIAMHNGIVVQDGTPEELYRHSETVYVAGLLGDYNLLSGQDLRKMGLPGFEIERQYMVRPESFHAVLPETANTKGRIVERHFIGFGYQLLVDVNGITLKTFTQYPYLQIGNTVHLQLAEADVVKIKKQK